MFSHYMLKRIGFQGLTLAVMLWALSGNVWAGDVINLEGQLADASGVLVNHTLILKFTVYNHVTEPGTLDPGTHSFEIPLNLKNGLYSVNLELPTGIFDSGQDLWVQGHGGWMVYLLGCDLPPLIPKLCKSCLNIV